MALGELIVWFTGLSLPGSIVGMLLLTAFLQMGWIKLEWVKGISDFLLSNLGFFFVPPGVAPFSCRRAGLLTARALGRARGIPVHGVPSLDAVARAALDELADEGATVLVTTDARRHEVYAARYRARGADDVECLDGPAVLTPEAAVALGDVDAVAGSGAALYPQIGEGRRSLAPISGDARAQVRIAMARLAHAGPDATLSAEPLYLRHADVQVSSARKRVR